MKHLKTASKKARPASAYVLDWFVNVWNGFPPVAGIITANGKANYANVLWTSTDSLDPTDINDVGLL